MIGGSGSALDHRIASSSMFAAVGLLLALHLVWLREPFDTSLGGTCSADDFGYSIQAFEAHGWLGLSTRPAWYFRAAETDTFVAYPNHPWLPYAWFLAFRKAFGADEAALRLGAIPLVIAGAAGIYALARRGGGHVFAALATTSFAVLPVIIQYGNMVDFSVFHPAFVPWVLWSWRRHRESSGSFGLFCALAMLAGMTSWYAFGLLPVLWWDRWLDGGRWRDLARSALLLASPFVVVLVGHGLWIYLTNDASSTFLQERLSFFLGVLRGSDEHTVTTFGRASYIDRMRSHLEAGVGWPLGCVALVGLGASILDLRDARKRSRARITLGLVAVGIINAVALWSRVAAHEFLVLVFAPGVALALARFGVLVRDAAPLPRRHLAVLLVTVVLAACGILRGWALHASYGQPAAPARAAAMALVFEPNAVVLAPTADYESGLRYYCRPGYLPALNSPETAELIAAKLAPGRTRIDRIAVLLRTETLVEMPWLQDLPLRPETFRELDLAGRRYVTVDLDPARFLPAN